MNPEHLYIHVPFCLRRCGYCDFAVTATSSAPVDAWLDAVARELRMRMPHTRLSTIYVGGGTPSLLGTGTMARLRAVLRNHADWDDATVEWTAEANPETFTQKLAEDWVAAGVNRVSLGAQTFHEPTLRWMGRMHGSEGPRHAVNAAKAAGIDNVSIDLIFGLPARLERSWTHDLARTLELDPMHVSLYGLTAESGTPLGRWVKEGSETMIGEERYQEEYLEAVSTLTGAAFGHYEVSNFARNDAVSRHNKAYWEHKPYIGLGPGAHSFDPPVRSWNVRDWAEYRRRLSEGVSPEDGRETLSQDDVALEAIWLGLRSDAGLDTSRLTAGQLAKAEEWRQQGWANVRHGTLTLNRRGWLLLDRLSVELDVARG